MGTIIALGIQTICILTAVTLHEFSRALVSTLLGDKKPKNDGRLTLNPINHFEPIGFILCLASGFGWGKPVETTALFYKNRKRDTLITAVIPSIVNLLMAFLCGICFSTIKINNDIFWLFIYLMININVSLAVYNLLPISPMDGLKVISAVLPANKYFQYLQYEKIVQMVFLLALFMGYADIIFLPIINTVMALCGIGI